MTEILTESFCERCGTRYTFESARPRVRLKGVKVLSRGLKNFVLSDDNSIDEAMAAARSDTDRELTAHQLDAFHKTFNFCMSCRQYTCPNCWNEAEARCLTCAPHLGHDVMPAPFPDLVTSSYLVADPLIADPLVADPVEHVAANGSNGAAHDTVIDDTPTPGVDVSDFATRLQALMAPPPLDEPPAAVVAEAVVADAVLDELAPEVPEDIATDTRDEIAAAAELAVGEPVADVDGTVATDSVAEVEAADSPVADSPIPYQVDPASGAVAARGAPVAPDVEPVAATLEPVAADSSATDQDLDEEAHIAARLAAFGAASVVADNARDDQAPRKQSAGKDTTQTGGLLRRFRAGQNLDAELDAYEQNQETPPVADVVEPEVAAAVVAAEALAAEPEIATEPQVAEPQAVEPQTAEPETAETEPQAVLAAEPEVVPEPEAVPAAEPEIVPPPEAVLAAAPEPESEIVAEQEAVFAEPEPEEAGAAAAVVAQPDDAAEPVPEPELAAAAAATIAAASADPPEAPVDVIPQPTWQMIAPDPATETEPPIAAPLPAAATHLDPTAEPQWPSRPEWPGGAPSAGLPFLNRPPTPTGGLEALWAESAREVVAPPAIPGRPVANAVQPCVSCGLSLSATARFCRRCGTPQAV